MCPGLSVGWASDMQVAYLPMLRKAHLELSLPRTGTAALYLDSATQPSCRILFLIYKPLKLVEKWSQVTKALGSQKFTFHTSRTGHSGVVVWGSLGIHETLPRELVGQTHFYLNTKMLPSLFTHSLGCVVLSHMMSHLSHMMMWDITTDWLQKQTWAFGCLSVEPDTKRICKNLRQCHFSL